MKTGDKDVKTGAVVVAAGLSSRMGAWKALLPYEETTVSRHIIMQLKELELDPILVVTGHRAEELETHLQDLDVQFLKNEHYAENQMFDSYRMGIWKIADACDRILFMPIDKPAIHIETFHQVLEVEEALVRTSWNGEPGHPLLIKREAAKKLCTYMGNRGMRGAMEESGVPITSLCVRDRGVVWDLDCPEDYQSMMQWKKQEKARKVNSPYETD